MTPVAAEGNTEDRESCKLAIKVIRQKPEEIIIHTGMNDLSSKDPKTLASNIISLAQNVRKAGIKPTISAPTLRKRNSNDPPNITDKLNSVNT